MPDGPLKEFAEDLRALRRATGMTYRALAQRAGYSPSVLSSAASGRMLPSLSVTLAYVGACNGDDSAWETRWNDLAAQLQATAPDLLSEPDSGLDRADRPEGPEECGRPVHSDTPLLPVASLEAPATAGPLSPDDPRQIGRFRVLGRLGGGAMGEVYLAKSPAGRPVAVKVVRAELARDQTFRRRFARELAAVREVSGGHTPAFIDADSQAERPWMATEFIPGPSLGHVIDSDGPLPVQVVRGIAAGVAEALAAIHQAGIVHRDLKPSNILLAQDGPKVIDFGISRTSEGTPLTATEAVMGTVGYTAPEQVARGEAGPAADVFSLGVVLAYAATGTTPFGQGRTSDVLFRIVHEPPAPESLACKDNNLRALIEHCLAKNPAKRPTPEQIIEAAIGNGRAGGFVLTAALAAQINRCGQTAAKLVDDAGQGHTSRRWRVGSLLILMTLGAATTAALTYGLSGARPSPNVTTSTSPRPVSPQPHAKIPKNGFFPLYNSQSGLCLGISAEGTAGQWTCTGNSDQTWHWGPTRTDDPDYAQLYNGNQACLSVIDGSVTAGARLIAYVPCSGGKAADDTYWKVMPANGHDSGQEIVNLRSGQDIAVSADSSDNGAIVEQWYRTGTPGQFWY